MKAIRGAAGQIVLERKRVKADRSSLSKEDDCQSRYCSRSASWHDGMEVILRT